MIIQKAIDKNKNTYFAFYIIKDSQEMDRIKSCPVRFWNKEYKVWLIPYSVKNRDIIKEKFKGIRFDISDQIITMVQDIIKVDKPKVATIEPKKYELKSRSAVRSTPNERTPPTETVSAYNSKDLFKQFC